MITISSDFDHGNIDIADAADPTNIKLQIKPDGKADFSQWFYYRVDGAAGLALTMNIINAGNASYARGWKDYRAAASYDGEYWFRVDTAYDGQTLTIQHKPEQDTVFYAYFAAYPVERYRAFVSHTKSSGLLSHSVLGQTLDGQAIDYFRAGDPDEDKLNLWVIARQHPGETMGSWWIEGFLAALNDETNEAAKTLRDRAVVHIIPCMNLDGAKRGHLRTNAAGTDLNRAWRNTTMDKSPEVFLVRQKMQSTGVDLFLDVHGDEAIPNNFLDGAKGIPSWNDRHEMLFNRFSALLLEESKDFQTKMGYPAAAPGKANLDIATNYMAETFGCLAMTLEMPFKDANVNPEPVQCWSPERCRNFAAEHLKVMAKMVGILKG